MTGWGWFGSARYADRLVAAAPVLLVVAVLARYAVTILGPNARNWVDLHVYVDGAARLTREDLYLYTYAEHTPDFPLPFTYPPFAAVVFWPLHFVPFTVVALVWQAATIAALFVLLRGVLVCIQPRLPAQRITRLAMLWTALGMWTEPMRANLDYGQVNVFLALGALVAVRSRRWWVTGLLIGLMAGIKLVPAVTGMYLVVVRRWKAAVASAVTFVGTIALTFVIARSETVEYFTTLFGDADRIGPVASVINQSLRGALSRLTGSDVGSGPVWIVAVGVAVVTLLCAYRALLRDGIPDPDGRGGDLIGLLVVTQLGGLLLSPISWSHHWVWIIVLAIWLVHGPRRDRPGARLLVGYWALICGVGVPWLLAYLQPSIWQIDRPLWESIAGACYAVGALATMVWIAVDRTTAHRPAGSGVEAGA